MTAIKIALIGEYNPNTASHLATTASIRHASITMQVALEPLWISSNEIDESLFREFTGIWIAPGVPHKNLEKTLCAIRYARENNIPCLGTCGGFQHMVLEYARHVLGYPDAQHTVQMCYVNSPCHNLYL